MFKNLVGGQTVYYRQYAGCGMKGPEYKEGKGKVNRLLIFQDHVVLNIGGKHGTPQLTKTISFARDAYRKTQSNLAKCTASFKAHLTNKILML